MNKKFFCGEKMTLTQMADIIAHEEKEKKEMRQTLEKPIITRVADIMAMEEFLSEAEIVESTTFAKKRIPKEYGLKRGRHTKDKDTIFNHLCEKYDRAKYYNSLTDLYYAIIDDRKEWEYRSA